MTRPMDPASKISDEDLNRYRPLTTNLCRDDHDKVTTGTPQPQTHRLLENLEGCDWEQLEKRYTDTMQHYREAEAGIRSQVTELLEIFMAWSHVTVQQDETRAFKRFKTQTQHVGISEDGLESKKKHYTEVVKAFESALALLDHQ
ncbi:hypothetical protein ASPZODRAFT_133344 [Penicilliopsis zonata CBS 506.65]|uniref:Uncharacterized protein n=1 Tax=Penicilliopsis zonata CBS 506.65 TaxID=1073090 RepID=A0A1L9SGR2_9EURO|nr:hypothetical protein ASPZODRAFT_133344 [Penicilliopsis zonata CBS 506.65]OJJ46313.1 hypothetical protein ASPZODRAFT_133344 [Penicilliopsis zonata CBS 506.65]